MYSSPFFIVNLKIFFVSLVYRRYTYFAMKQSILHYGITARGGLGIITSNKILKARKKHNKNNIEETQNVPL